MCCRVGLFLASGAFDVVEHLVALINSGSSLLLAGKACRVTKIANNPAVP